MGSIWRVHERTDKDLLRHLCAVRGLDVNTLEPNFATGLNDPMLLPDMDIAVALIVKAKQNGWPTLIFGDYDADGTPASAVLSHIMERLDIPHSVVLPTRSEGYGLNTEAIERIPSDVKLLITVDTGITAVTEIALAKKKGMAVIVLDHHLPKDELPPADALVDPFLSTSKYPFNGLCGCALAWKLAVALSQKFPKELNESFIKWLLDLVAISTVSDMMPIIGENRVLVHYGLTVLRKNRRPGLRAMFELATLDPSNLTAGNLGYSIGPRLNASGRLKDNRPAFDLLMAPDYSSAMPLAQTIEQANRERQDLVEKVLAQADKELFIQNKNDDHCFLLLGEDWPSGVLGLVAGKLTGKYTRPVIVASGSGDTVGGSARSTGAYSIIDGLNSQAKLLERFGGHEQAAGISLQKSNWPKFVDGIKKHAQKNLPAEDMVAKYLADAVLDPGELNLKTVDVCDKLQPFGLQNNQPLFIIENATLGTPKALGNGGKHLKWQAKKEGTSFDVIGFGFGAKQDAVNLEQANLLGYLEANTWRDNTKLQLRLVDLAPSDRNIETV